MKLKRLNKIKINSAARSSRFVIDLKDDSLLNSAKTQNNFNNLKIESGLERLAELDYKRFFNQGKTKAKEALFDFKNNILPPGSDPVKILAGEAGISHGRNKLYQRLNQLAAVIFIKFIALILYRIFRLGFRLCYGVGWLTLFTGKFIYLLLAALIKPPVSIIGTAVKNIFSRTEAEIIESAPKAISHFAPAADNQAEKFSADDRSAKAPIGLEKAGLRLNWHASYLKSVTVFAGVLFLLVLPVKALTYYKVIDQAKGRVLGTSESAINNLISAGQAAASLDFERANQSFAQASDNFLNAQGQLSEINSLLFTLAGLIPSREIQLAAVSKNLARAGELGASAGKNLSLAAASLLKYDPENNLSLLSDFSGYGRLAAEDLTALNQEINALDSALLPAEHQAKFIVLKQKISDLNYGLSELVDLCDKLQIILGQKELKRYLLVFQNNAEIRASGGFVGSFAVADFLNGQIKKIEAPGGGSYDTDAGLLKRIKSPEPLRLVRPDWHFWDANWWPDWPSSARKLAWFYANSDGSTVDGVIGLTPTVMERILAVIGPIDLREEYGVILEADNFWQITQEFAEQKPNITKEPKKIIGDMLSAMIEELPRRVNAGNLPALLKAVEASLDDKNILFYFTDDELTKLVADLGWDGRVKETSGDYLNVVNTNIAGAKTDRRIKQQISHQAEIMPDGTIIDNLTIKRTHEGVKYEQFSGVRNVNWLRIYVPLGSKLISAEGFRPVDKIFFKTAEDEWLDDPDVARGEGQAETDEASGTKIYQELDKTVFANWSQVDPGETAEIRLRYQLPFKLTDRQTAAEASALDQLIDKISFYLEPEQKNLYSYSLLLQKQPGMNNSEIVSQLKLSANLKPVYLLPGDLSPAENGWLSSSDFNRDFLSAALIEME